MGSDNQLISMEYLYDHIVRFLWLLTGKAQFMTRKH